MKPQHITNFWDLHVFLYFTDNDNDLFFVYKTTFITSIGPGIRVSQTTYCDLNLEIGLGKNHILLCSECSIKIPMTVFL